MDGNLFFVCFALFCFDERWTAFQPTSTKAPLMLPHKFRLKWKMRQQFSLCRWQSLGNGKVCNSFCVYSLHLDCLSSLNVAGSTWFNSSVRTWLQRLDHAKRQELSNGLQLGLSLVMLFCRWKLSNLSNSQREFPSTACDWVKNVLGIGCLQFTNELLNNFSCIQTTMRWGAKFKKNPMRLQWRQSSVWLWNAKWPNRKCRRVAHHMVAAKTRITNHFSSSISMMYRCRWSTNMVTMYCRGWPSPSGTQLDQQHFRHQPTVKRKVERGVPNATNSLTPEDPGSILAIVSYENQNWMAGPLQPSSHPHNRESFWVVTSISKVSRRAKVQWFFPRTIELFRRWGYAFWWQTRTRSNMEQKRISSNPRGLSLGALFFIHALWASLS